MSLQLTQQLTNRLIVAILLVFALYSNARLVVRNNALNHQILLARDAVQQKANRNRKLELISAYYQSPSYQEVEARRRLGMKKADETVLVVKGLPESKPTDDLISEVYEQPKENQIAKSISNPALWWQYFFGKKR